MIREALLVLSDGEVFEGEAIGAEMPVATGEVVFNTVLTGYQEVITDPSYAGQIITFTTPHIGNYGVNLTDFESRRIFCRGVIMREMARRRSNWRAQADLKDMLIAYGIPGIAGIDTRRLTRHIRDTGAMPGAFGTADEATLRAAALAEPGTDGVDLVAQVTTPQPYALGAEGGLRVVAYDFGIKHTILRHLAGIARVEVVPAHTTAAAVLARKPDGVFLSNGPGDPAMSPYAVMPSANWWTLACRPSVSASVISCSAERWAATRSSSRSVITEATTPCNRCRPARWKSPARTTTSASPPTRSVAEPTSRTST